MNKIQEYFQSRKQLKDPYYGVSSKTLDISRERIKSDRRGENRIGSTIMSLIVHYAVNQGIDFDDLKTIMQDDPKRVETFFREAVMITPREMLPSTYWEFKDEITKDINASLNAEETDNE